MQLHQLKPKKLKNRKRIGRGGKRGTYSGRGIKGQNARSGSSRRPAILDLIRKIPKKRGVPASRYKKQGIKRFKIVYQIVKLGVLNKNFKDGETVSPQTLLDKRLVHRIKGKMPHVKILAVGKLDKKLNLIGIKVSKNVK